MQGDLQSDVLKVMTKMPGTSKEERRPKTEENEIQCFHSVAATHDHMACAWQGELQEDVLKVMTKKFSTSAKVWLAAIQVCVRQKDVTAARAWLERSTKALPQRKHIKVPCRLQ